jgi:DNA-binding IclR family transcriptional regulator
VPERDDDTGQWTADYPREAFLDAIENLDGMAATGEIAAEVGCVRETAYKKLKQMEEDGEVTSRDAGGSLLWRLAE